MNDKDYIKDLFADKLGKHEVKVNPELWNGIASKLGNTGAVGSGAASGISVLTKGIIALVVGTAAVVGVVLVLNQEEPTIKKKPNTQVIPTLEKKTENTVQENETTAEQILNRESHKQEVPELKEVPELSIIEQGDLAIQPKREVLVEEKTEAFPQLEKDRLIQEDNPLEDAGLLKEEESSTPEQEEMTEQKETIQITLPNIFSPNGDGQNDYLEISHDQIVLSDFSVVVMNQQSQMVFQSADPAFKWDGLDRNGTPVPAGKYLYYVTARDENGKPINRYSNLVIIR